MCVCVCVCVSGPLVTRTKRVCLCVCVCVSIMCVCVWSNSGELQPLGVHYVVHEKKTITRQFPSVRQSPIDGAYMQHDKHLGNRAKCIFAYA